MRNRLSKIYTRTGDQGMTSLGEGTRVPKDNPRVEAYGNVDELNSVLGLLLAEGLPEELGEALLQVQQDLLDLGGELCIPGYALLKGERIAALEALLDLLNRDLEPLREFILPGGTRPAALCHLARTVCRRTERSVVTLSRSEQVRPEALAYLNRLSDLLFVMARSLNRRQGKGDLLWRHQRKPRGKTPAHTLRGEKKGES